MGDLTGVEWPVRLQTERLTLRAMEPRDRTSYINLLTSPEVRKHLGGPLDRDALEVSVPRTPGAHPGVFAVEHGDGFVGTVSLNRRDLERPGHTKPEGLELEVSYTLLPDWWGMSYATEAVLEVLDWARACTPDPEVLLCTQVTNERSMALARRLRFREIDRFMEFGAMQWLGVRDL
jgi:RimJ/RimL family protein N-acetyltransferase